MKKTVIARRWDAIVNRIKIQRTGLMLLQYCADAVIVFIMVIFSANYPAGVPVWRFWGTVVALAMLLAISIFGIKPRPAASKTLRRTLDWTFLILSALLVLVTVWLSGQYDLVYLLSVVCIYANVQRGIWPGGVIFSAACLIGWLSLQFILRIPSSVIVAREGALAIGIVFGLLAVALLNRFNRQTQLAEGLLKELQAANKELEAAQLKEKNLAIAEERIRLARELHDSVTQSLYSVALYAEAAAELIHSGDSETAAGHLQELRDTAQEALREMRLLIFELRRPTLEQSGLAAALQARLDAVERRGGLRAELQVEGMEHLSAEVKAELYGITQEALNNALKHAQANKVTICLRFDEAACCVEVEDDGVGFDPVSDRTGSGFGLAGMKERAQKIGATLKIDSQPGKGSRVTVCAPSGLSTDLDQAESGPVRTETE